MSEKQHFLPQKLKILGGMLFTYQILSYDSPIACNNCLSFGKTNKRKSKQNFPFLEQCESPFSVSYLRQYLGVVLCNFPKVCYEWPKRTWNLSTVIHRRFAVLKLLVAVITGAKGSKIWWHHLMCYDTFN